MTVKMKRKSAFILAVAMSGVFLAGTALADQQGVDNDLATSGNQNIVNLTVAPGATVETEGQIVITWSGGNHVAANSNIEFAVIPSQTNLPTGRTVTNATVPIPSPWSNGMSAFDTSYVSFTAPSVAGFYPYTVKWASTTDYGNKLTGAPALVINLTVEAEEAGDTTPPVIVATVDPEPNGADWNNSDVTVSWSVTDDESDFTTDGCDEVTLTDETDGTDVTCEATSDGGFDSETVTVKIDRTAPEIAFTAPFDGAVYSVGQVVNADYECSDLLSGIDTCEGDVPNEDLIDTTTAGLHRFTVTAKDIAGNETVTEVEYSVGYIYDGPKAPLTMTTKVFKQTSTIPVKFTLLDYFGNPFSGASATLSVNGINAVASGGSNVGNTFRYSASGGQYIFNLSTKPLTLVTNLLVITIDGVSQSPFTITIRF